MVTNANGDDRASAFVDDDDETLDDIRNHRCRHDQYYPCHVVVVVVLVVVLAVCDDCGARIRARELVVRAYETNPNSWKSVHTWDDRPTSRHIREC